ncbi:MAG: hypothetical protein ACE5E4_03955 [Candidatus Binatia bacterium]
MMIGLWAKRRTTGILFFCVAFVAGCYWLRYPDIVRTHVELLERMALDGRDMVAAGMEGRLDSRELERFRYPLERAKGFQRLVGPRFAGKESLALFSDFLGEYEALLELMEAGPSASKARLPRIKRGCVRLRDLARRILRALDDEAG